MKWMMIALGGGLGSVSRYAVSAAVQHFVRFGFPLGTAVVNLLGCFAIGLVSGMAANRSPLSEEMRFLVLVGFLGGFTTFSTFGADTVNLIRNNAWGPAFFNAVGQVVLGVAAVFAGLWAGTR